MASIGRPITDPRSEKPYRLHGLLAKYGIPHSELRANIKFEAGSRAGDPIASSTLSQLLTRHAWPRTIRPEVIREQVAAFLAAKKIPQEEIDTCWYIDGSDAEVFEHPTLLTELQPEKPSAAHPADLFQLPEAEMLSHAARMHFNLPRHPFLDDVQGPQDVYLSKAQRYVRESMYYAARHSGFIAVVGESGSGKSTLRRDLVDRVRTHNDPIVIIQPQTVDKRQLTAAHICDAIIADLSTEVPKLSLEAKGRQIQRILASSARTGLQHVLLIEEAHDLNIATLKYLKRFWELEDGFKKLLGIILIGQPELGDRLDERRNYDAREVIRRCEIARLSPLNGNLEEYLTLKFNRVQVKLESIFEPDAYDAIRARLTRRRPGTNEAESQLYPLVVQNLIVKCMNQAVELGLPKVSGELVGRV
ncbi:MAG: ExeA family protein [Dyella sp.]|uniref:ExeA family protein n=1 Tax=Dyella sp. TaxID=1869338 RepID=UPI003F7F215E